MIKLIAGHDYMDLDSLSSVVLASCLYPDFLPLKNRLAHPLASNVCNVYHEHLGLSTLKDIKGRQVEELIIVDTSEKSRVKEIFHALPSKPHKITIIDHHGHASTDIEGAHVISHAYGSNATFFALELKRENRLLSQEIATVGLLGIYADTGSFGHEGVTEGDFEAASYLLSQGAIIPLIKHFLKVPPLNVLEDYLQMSMQRLTRRFILGRQIGFFMLDIPHLPGLATIVDRLFDIASVEVLFACFAFREKNQMLLVARSQTGTVNVANILACYGGGGHVHSASATLKETYNLEILDEILEELRRTMIPALSAKDMMQEEESLIYEDWSLYEASVHLENTRQHSGIVVNRTGLFVSTLDLGQISQARKNGKMQDLVKNHCEKNPIYCDPDALLYEIENIFFMQAVAKIPVVTRGELCGTIPRETYLNFLYKTHAV